MNASHESEKTPMKNPTTAERISDRELVVTRTFDAPARLVFEAWTNAELFPKWWVPKSFGITVVSCELDARTGGSYKLLMRPRGAPEPMAFFGRYLEVTPHSKIVWTNEEGADGGQISTVTLEEKAGRTLVRMHDLYPSQKALDEAIASGATSGTDETFDQLAELVGG